MTEPLTLPPCEPRGPDPAALTGAVEAWVRSPALAGLVAHFGGEIPDGALAPTLDHLVEFSQVWDFRGGVRERFDTDRLDYGDADPRLRALIHTLGLGGRDRPTYDRYDHVLVLGGGIRVTLGRTEYVARLLADGLRVGSVTGLGSLRWRDDREHREGVRHGLDPFETEADMMMVGMRRALKLPDPTRTHTADGWWHRVWDGPYPVHVLAAESTRPPLRANTADTLIGWATRVHTPAAHERVLLVTNHPYVLHQHCDAVRLLGGRYGCGVETVGFDEQATRAWGRPLATTELLQEVRSALFAMRGLLGSVAPPG